jgi:uncharacterized membrane protein YhaH (DUF805 family)
MPVLRQQPTVVIHEDQVVKLRFASRNHSMGSREPAVYIAGTSRGICINSTEPLSHTNSIAFNFKGDVASYPGQAIYTSFLKTMKNLSTKAQIVVVVVWRLLLHLALTLRRLLETLGSGVAILIRVVAALMETIYDYLVLPFTSVSLLYFGVVALRQYQAGQTIVLDSPFVVCLLYTAYTFAMTGLLLIEKYVVGHDLLIAL